MTLITFTMDVDEFQIAKLRAELLDTARNWAEHSTFDGSYQPWSHEIFSEGGEYIFV